MRKYPQEMEKLRQEADKAFAGMSAMERERFTAAWRKASNEALNRAIRDLQADCLRSRQGSSSS